MSSTTDQNEPRTTWLNRQCSPFLGAVPAHVRDAMVEVQYRRLHAILPILCLIIAANTAAMAVAVHGELPLWQQVTPPLLIGGTCILLLLFHNREQVDPGPRIAFKRLSAATLIAAPLGLIASAWCVNAFVETEEYYCMVSPVMIALSAMVAANCLSSAPRAALAAMAATLTPVVVKLLMQENIGLKAMAIMLALIALLQAGVVISRFRETVRTLVLQHELNRLAESDSLTGLDNRLAFMRKLKSRLDLHQPVVLALADLNGFKQANDSHGHHAGDAVLLGVAERMHAVTPSALSVARLGGDEFALLFDGTTARDQIDHEVAAVRSTVAMPHVVGTALIRVSTCIGLADTAGSGFDLAMLMQDADRQLYAEKAARKKRPEAQSAGTSQRATGHRRRWRA